ncbi:MAG: glycine betaine/L-proline ABC transporter ATP-binding protein [Geminicoccaceae bacterium]
MTLLRFDHVDIVFGKRHALAHKMIDRGESKDEIFAKSGQVVAVRDATFGVQRGEIFVLMGLSGSGKSTLMRAANGLANVTRGKVYIDDRGEEIGISDCSRGMLRHLRTNRISMVFQQFALMPWRTVAENVGLGLEVRGVRSDLRRRRVAEVLDLVGLSEWARKYPHELSGGMQQRVGLARAFATDADLLLMDEPYSALDPLIRERLQDELLLLQRGQRERARKTILFVSHDLDEALKLGTRIAIMESGEIVQIGTAEDIVTRPASEYVRQFIANVNPLNALKAGTAMRRIDDLPRDPQANDHIYLDETGSIRLRLNAAGQPVEATVNGMPASGMPYDDGLDLSSVPPNALIAATPELPLRTVLELFHATGRTVPIVDDGGRLLGALGARELAAGILRKPPPKRRRKRAPVLAIAG